ncbi:MAG TPA: CHAP domain-containing protein [Pyrinomonadaceae bacterium]|nr:CHAP domain-containing protein [Pyrinomonadaceae bacterium]
MTRQCLGAFPVPNPGSSCLERWGGKGYCGDHARAITPVTSGEIPRGHNVRDWPTITTLAKGWVPVKGAIVIFDIAPSGHAAVVEEVLPDGWFRVSQMNWGNPAPAEMRAGCDDITVNFGCMTKMECQAPQTRSDGSLISPNGIMAFIYPRNVKPLTAPSLPMQPISVGPASGTWNRSPQVLQVSSPGASRIYYRVSTSYDGSLPPDPSAPTAAQYDGIINGSSGPFQVYASPGQLKRLRVKFVAQNPAGLGAPSVSYMYAIDLRPPSSSAVGPVAVSPGNTVWLSAPQYLQVSSPGAARILYTATITTDGSEPPDPPDPNASTARGSVFGNSGSVSVSGDTGQLKRVKLKFAAQTSSGVLGPSSSVYMYAVDLRPAPAGPVSVSPESGTWLSAQYVRVASTGASRIWYTVSYTTDGSSPPDPPDPISATNRQAMISAAGSFQAYGTPGQLKRLKVKFQAQNSAGAFGPVSPAHMYAIDLRPTQVQRSAQTAPSTLPSAPQAQTVPLRISGVSPYPVKANQEVTLDIRGWGFQPGLQVSVVMRDGTAVQLTPSAITPAGTGDRVFARVTMRGSPPFFAVVRITNPDGKTANNTIQVVP